MSFSISIPGFNRPVKVNEWNDDFGNGYYSSVLTPSTIEIVGFLGGAARFITKPYLKQRVMRFPTIRYGCSA